MPPTSIVVRRRVQWFDTDASSKYHNTAPLRLMEEAEAALLDRLGIVHEVYGWMPRVHVSIDYRRPVRFWDPVEVELVVADVGRSSITYRFEIRADGGVAAEGTVVAAFIGEDGQAREWSPERRELLASSGPLRPASESDPHPVTD